MSPAVSEDGTTGAWAWVWSEMTGTTDHWPDKRLLGTANRRRKAAPIRRQAIRIDGLSEQAATWMWPMDFGLSATSDSRTTMYCA